MVLQVHGCAGVATTYVGVASNMNVASILEKRVVCSEAAKEKAKLLEMQDSKRSRVSLPEM